MGRPVRDLAGERFGRLLVVGRDANKPSKAGAYWNCVCDCGKESSVRSGPLVNGQSTSCGCLSKELTRARSIKHGMEGTPSYQLWDGMVRRCSNKNHAAYENYGARGIKVCERWLEFSNFYEDMGVRPDGMSLDRIDNNKGYSPDNCRWATHKQQCRNTRSNHLKTLFCETRTIAGWADEFSLSYNIVYLRIRMGWPLERAVLTPPAR